MFVASDFLASQWNNPLCGANKFERQSDDMLITDFKSAPDWRKFSVA
ncbi:hypothetical protein [Paludibacter sp. 221]|nr:hypothetical protein [Paludibacter sp. 221]